MVKVYLCDRCGESLQYTDSGQGIFDNVFFEDEFQDTFENFNVKLGKKLKGSKINYPQKVIKAQLCQDCLVRYNQIVEEANREISEYIQNGRLERKKTRNNPTEILLKIGKLTYLTVFGL